MAAPRQTIFEGDYDGVEGRLEIDGVGRLYWNGERIAMETLRLSNWQKVGAVLTVTSAVVVASVSVIQYVWPYVWPSTAP